MSVIILTSEQKRCQLIKEYADDHHCLELLQFFGKYPHTRFSRLAIIHALNNGKLALEKSLKQLEDKGILKSKTNHNTILYWLTEEEQIRGLVSELAKLDWRQWQQIFQGTHPACTQLNKPDSTPTNARLEQ